MKKEERTEVLSFVVLPKRLNAATEGKKTTLLWQYKKIVREGLLVKTA